MSVLNFFTQIEQELRRRHARFDAAELLAYVEVTTS
jgi:hypothetical protein